MTKKLTHQEQSAIDDRLAQALAERERIMKRRAFVTFVQPARKGWRTHIQKLTKKEMT